MRLNQIEKRSRGQRVVLRLLLRNPRAFRKAKAENAAEQLPLLAQSAHCLRVMLRRKRQTSPRARVKQRPRPNALLRRKQVIKNDRVGALEHVKFLMRDFAI